MISYFMSVRKMNESLSHSALQRSIPHPHHQRPAFVSLEEKNLLFSWVVVEENKSFIYY
jgi:hypothetical protein